MIGELQRRYMAAKGHLRGWLIGKLDAVPRSYHDSIMFRMVDRRPIEVRFYEAHTPSVRVHEHHYPYHTRTYEIRTTATCFTVEDIQHLQFPEVIDAFKNEAARQIAKHIVDSVNWPGGV